MPTVTAGTSTSETLSARSTVAVTLDSAERAIVSVARLGAQVARDLVSNGSTVGPYLAGDVLTVEALRGDVDYTVTAYTPAYPSKLEESLTSLQVAWVQSSVSGGVAVTVAMVQANTPPPGGADGYCIITDGDGSVYPRGWQLYWLSSGPYYTLADIRSLDGKVS